MLLVLPVGDNSRRAFRRCSQRLASYVVCRWSLFAVGAVMFVVRIYTTRSWYIVAYVLGMVLLNNILGVLYPQINPDAERLRGPSMPRHLFRRSSRERVQHLREFPCWVSSQKWLLVSFGLTLFRLFDVPVFAPILAAYFVVVLVLSLWRGLRARRQFYENRRWVL